MIAIYHVTVVMTSSMACNSSDGDSVNTRLLSSPNTTPMHVQDNASRVLTGTQCTGMFSHRVSLLVAHVSVVVSRHASVNWAVDGIGIALPDHVEDAVVAVILNEVRIARAQQTCVQRSRRDALI